MTLFTFSVIRLLILSALAAVIAFLLAPHLIRFLNKIKFWKKEARRKTITGEEAKVFYSLHKEREVTVPRGGGVLIWLTALIVVFLFLALSSVEDPWWLKNFNFFSRAETWLPLFTLIAAAIVGLADDILQITGKGEYIGGGMGFTRRLLIVVLIGLVGGWWFYAKLDWSSIHIPLVFNFPYGIDLFLDYWIVPFFVLVMVACWSGGVIDGLDGLSGGVFAAIFGAFAIIALDQGRADLATFCAVITGTLFAFLWFNIPPAKFYMGETGILGLTSTMAVVAFLTDSVVVLPIIAGIIVVSVGSIILQLLSKKIRKKKIWLSTPIHHHFEARGWPSYQITMRFWIISLVLAFLGVAIRLLG
ncbi:MAG TPA: hypothetical protein VMV66_03080 [Candidatus Humimicrobiaceae bacterium]|nr:hypothetical protein [Candidatus Humimicrobiaceae bacterium]